jgi:uncharacterized protein
MSSSNLTRRKFILSTLGATGAAMLPGVRSSSASPRLAEPSASEPGEQQIQPFPLNQVRLLDGPFKQATEANRNYLVSLPNDRLLHMFRLTAGLPSSAEPLGGWEKPDCELRGHFTGGHFLSASALMAASEGDQELKSKANSMIEDLYRCQRANGQGYLSAFPTELFARLKRGQNVWAPFYTYHKIMAGHLDTYLHAGNEQALQTAEGMAAWASAWAKDIPDDQMQRILNVEYGGMQEVLANLYAVTNNEEYLALSRRFDHHSFFDPLAEHQDGLKGLHANTHVPQVIGAARRYELAGDRRDRAISDYFWKEVTSRRCYCTGGTSNDEHWLTAPGVLASQLSNTTQECCVEYNMLKLTRHVYSWSTDPHMMDYYERTLFNSRLGTQDASTGMKMYFLPLAAGWWKFFSSPFDSFWCCLGTGVEEFSKFGNSIYWHDADDLYVNLFISSELSWPDKGIRVRQQTRFPQQEGAKFTLQTERPIQMAIRIRVPWWCEGGASVRLNGKLQKVAAIPSSYIVLDREWQDGDEIEIGLPMKLRIVSMPDDESIQAVMYGPLVLAGRLGAQGLTRDMMYGGYGTVEKGKAVPAPQIHAASSGAADWVEPVHGRPLTFRTVGQNHNVELIPLNSLFDERYLVYWRTDHAA